jgi:hypothetical protein
MEYTSTRVRYRITAATAPRVGEVPPGGTADKVVLVCSEPRRPVDVTIATPAGARIEGPPLGPEPGPSRVVGVRLGPVDVGFIGRPCAA